METPADFTAWALSPDRTVEEAYLAERIVENGVTAWRSKHKDYRPEDWDLRHERARARRLNPAHRARLNEEDVKQAAEMVGEMNYLNLDCYQDRPLRDLSGLRFLPNLTSVNLGWSEVKDISPIAGLSKLAEFHLTDYAVEDVGLLGRCVNLRYLVLRIHQPWPTLAGLENLSQVHTFHYHGNLLPLEDVPRLAGVQTCVLEVAYPLNLPPRNCLRFPEMPALRSLDLSTVHRLDGINRWPALENLTISGELPDLAPLTECRALTHLTIKGNFTRDLSPLARLPELRHLTIQGDHPQDYSVLAEAPRLHEVTAKGCDINKMELGALQASLSPWEEEFALPEPRPLKPLRFISLPHKELLEAGKAGKYDELRWNGNQGLCASEGDWFKRRLYRRIRQATGVPKWGYINGCSQGHAFLTIGSLDAAERLPDIVRLIRETMAAARLPWVICLFVDLDCEWIHDDEQEPELREALSRQRLFQDVVDENIEYEKRQREHREFLERLHRLNLLQQEGRQIDPQQFAAPEAPPIEPEQTEEAEDVDAGDVLEKQPPKQTPEPQGSHPLAKILYVLGTITEDALFVHDDDRLAAVQLMGREPDEG